MTATAWAGRGLPTPLRFALRELRGGLKGFYVFIACIALGVAAIAAVGSVSRALQDGISEQGQTILGGDLAVSLIHREADREELELLESLGDVSRVATLRAMARRITGTSAQALVELKAVDDAYPLVGELTVAGGGNPSALLARDGETFGLLAEPAFAVRIGAEIGDEIQLGGGRFVLTGLIEREPDRLSSGGVGWGPRVMISVDALTEAGLSQPGSLVRWRYRIALPPPASDAQLQAATAEINARADQSGWRVRPRDDAAPGLAEQISRFSMFLTMVGLTALLVGGVGVANAVNAYLDSRRETIATLKSLGAPGGLVFRTYLIEMMLLTAVAMAIGLAIGAAMPWLVGSTLSSFVPVADAVPGLYPGTLVQAAAYGALTALAFALWPLGRARDIPPTALYRDHVATAKAWPRRRYIAALGLIVALLIGLAVLLAFDTRLALYFVAGALGAFLILRIVAALVMALARRAPRIRSVALRLAIAAIHRPGAVTPSVILSLGLGLSLLATIALVDGNLTRQLTHNMPDRAPSFYFLDIPRADAQRFDAFVTERAPDGVLESVPMMRGRIVSLAGTSAADFDPPPDAAWVLRGDRGVTYADEAPDHSEVVEGEWWAPDYDGPPLVSLTADIAEAFGLEIGDEIEINVLGRPIRAEIANLRTVDWQSLSINFILIFSPNTFAGAPHMQLATITMPDGVGNESELALMRAVTEEFPTVTTVRVREALDSVSRLVERLTWAVRSASGFTLVAGVLVLAGALAASHRHRIHDAVVLKTLGAGRRRLVSAYALEFALLGLVTALFALAAGTLAAWIVVTQVMRLDFAFLPAVALIAVVAALTVTVGLGLAGTWRVLGRRPAQYLREL